MSLLYSLRRSQATYAAAALLAAMSTGCGGNGVQPETSEAGTGPQVIAASEPADDADAAPSGSTGSARDGYEKAAAAYDRIEAPVGGEAAIGAAAIAAVQAVFDKLGDELSSL
jgi:hypothetical protein